MDSEEMKKVRRYAMAKQRVVDEARELMKRMEGLFAREDYQGPFTDVSANLRGALFDFDEMEKPKGLIP